MKPHDKITILRNRHRVRELRDFRELVEVYYERASYDEDDLLMDWEGAQAARSEINQRLPRIIQIVLAAGFGGRDLNNNLPGPPAGGVEVLRSIFNARYTDGAHQEVLDTIDMARGVYEAGRFSALARTFNPFHYLFSALGAVAQLPGRALRSVFGPSRRSVRSRAQAEDLIETRFAEMREWQERQFNDATEQLTELAERLDFAERLLSERREEPRLRAPHNEGVSTPV